MKPWNVFAALVVFALLVAACAPAATPTAAPTAVTTESPATAPTQVPAAGKTQITMWYHGAGNDVEKKIITQIIDDFNQSQDKYEVVRQDFPQASYNDSVVAGALAGNLPDIIDMDGPNMPNWAWSGYLAPLNLPAGALDNFLPGTIGKWDGKVYSVGLWDAACGIYARKSVLDENGIRIPTFDKPWTKDEFDAALVTLQNAGKYEYPFNVGMAWTGEWYPYAFSPFMQSFGGDIVDRSTYLTAQGTLNGPNAIAFGTWWQSLITRKLLPGPTQSSADAETGFVSGKYALQYAGNWSALAAIDKFGPDMLFLPPPDFGHGPKIGAASWQFGVSAKSKQQDGANAWIAFALQDKYLAAFSNGIGLIPATKSAAALTKNYAPDGPLAVFYDLSSKYGTIRPPTPAYLTAAKIFEKAIADISNGADATTTLDNAADEIDKDIQSNNGYGFKASTQAPAATKTQITMWYHGAGNEVEKKVLTQIIDDFNASQDKYEVVRQDFPQNSYNDSVVAGALAGNLPDIIDMDGPNMPNWAWSGYLTPLSLPAGALDNFLPGTIGKWDEKVYSVGLWDAACAIVARKSVLDENGIRVPTFDKPWTKDEFDAALVTLQKTGKFQYPFNIGMAWTGEWYPYAISPFLQSFGGDILDRETFLTAQGALNGPDAIAFGKWWQSLITRKLMPGPTQSSGDAETGFLDGKYAMQYAGNWTALAGIDKFGSDLLFLPPPDFGHGPKIGAASWQFGISAKSQHQDGANAWIAFAIQDKYLAAFSNAIGLIPATKSAAALTKNYAPGGQMAVFYDLSSKYGLIRPPTPAYLTDAKIFEKAIADISNGADVTTTFDNAADEIDKDIQSNKGYGFE